ncbi:MAG: sulfatase-like hydrolase/transferase [Bacteroidales bacterium]
MDQLRLSLKEILPKTDLPVKNTAIFFLTLLVIRITEFLYFAFVEVSYQLPELAIGILNDLLLACWVGLLFILLFIFLPKRLHRILYTIHIISIFLLTLLAIGLNEYYFETLIPVDQSILIYSWSDLLYITTTSSDFDLAILARGTIAVLILIFLLVFIYKKNTLKNSTLLSMLGAILLVFGLQGIIIPDVKDFTSNRRYHQQVNKIQHLSSSLWKNYHSAIELSQSDIIKESKRFQLENRHFNYLTPQYPFFRKREKKDVLSNYFHFNEEPPNLVFVIVESLSRKFSGPGCEWESFTPVLDSLAEHSLYWTNFVSTSERTFNVMPSTFASLPYGEKGFMALAEDTVYPNFTSLPEIIKQEGYLNNFFYGGWVNFDKMNVFLDSLQFDHILNDKKFGDKYQKIQKSERGFTWGYPDHAVFQRAMEIIDTLPRQPRLDVYMTLSMHSPFFPPNEEKWRRKVHRRLEKLHLDEDEKDFYLRRELIFATIMYTDHSIGELIEDYSRRPGFNNTIFVVMGDHHLATSDYSPIEKYHVPLMIFSPMLKESKIFPAVSSTADITPTFLNLLANNFDVKTPKWVPWLGRQLDTSSVFRSNNFVPFMRVNRNIDELLFNDLFYSQGRLFEVKQHLDLQPIDDADKMNMMKEKIKTFNALNDYVCFHNMIYNPIQ